MPLHAWHTNPQILVAVVFAVLPAHTMMSLMPVKLIWHTKPKSWLLVFPRIVARTQCCAGGMCINVAPQSTYRDCMLFAIFNKHFAALGACASAWHTDPKLLTMFLGNVHNKHNAVLGACALIWNRNTQILVAFLFAMWPTHAMLR